MRIGMFLDTDFPPDARVENEIESLTQDGHEVHLFSLCRKPIQKKVEKLENVLIHRFSYNRLTYKLSALAYDVPFFRFLIQGKVRAFIKTVKPEAIHVHDMVIAKAVLFATRSYHVVKTVDLHENRPEIMEMYPHIRKFPGRYLINLDRWRKAQQEIIRKYDKVIVVTEEAKDEYISVTQEVRDKFIVVPNTLFPERFRVKELGITAKYQNCFTILYVGNTGLRRGTLLALESILLLKKEIPSIKLILVGDSSEDYILKDFVDYNRIQEWVDFEGWVRPELLPSYINAANVCISPLKRNLHHDTTFANKIFQYMAIGKPVVVSDCPPQKRIAETYECGLVHEADNKKDFIEKVLLLFNDRKLSSKLGENGKRVMERELHFRTTSKSLRDFYLSIDSRKSD